MGKKRYGVSGYMEYTIKATLQRRVFVIPFRNGITSLNGQLPATYDTDNPIIQFAIEKSTEYRQGIVTDMTPAAWKDKEKTVAQPKSQTSSAVESTDGASDDAGQVEQHPEVTKFGEAVALLKSLGVSASELTSKDGVFKAAKKLGIAFPNYQ